MRKIALLALLVAAPAEAIDFLYADNEVGGRIVLYNNQCEDSPGMYQVRAIDKHGKVWHSGCWRKIDNQFEVQWSDGERFVYDATDFQLTFAACAIMMETGTRKQKRDAVVLGCEPEEHTP